MWWAGKSGKLVNWEGGKRGGGEGGVSWEGGKGRRVVRCKVEKMGG